MAFVVDTNVPMVASRLAPQADEACVDACVQRLFVIMRSGGLLVDEDGLIVNEYIKRVGLAGKPGAGKAFVKWAHDHQYTESMCTRVSITRLDGDGWRLFEEFPTDDRLERFHRDDQKFVAVARASQNDHTVLNATDSDWWRFKEVLHENGVMVEFLCPEQFVGATRSGR